MARIVPFHSRKGGADMHIPVPDKMSTPEARAERTLQEFRVTSVPVNPVDIAKRAGIQILSAQFTKPGVSGLIKKQSDGHVSIYVNQLDSLTRQRFTIAHELGHLFLHLTDIDGNFVDSGKQEVFYRDDTTSPQEIEANQYAAALLMPRAFVQRYWEKGYSIYELQHLFDVSEQSMQYRVKNLGMLR